MQIAFPEDYSDWRSVPPISLYEAPIIRKVSDDCKDVEKNLLNLSPRADELVLWLDCDREGENIAFEVMEVCLQANSSLVVRRAQFSALTATDILRAWGSLKSLNKALVEAVDARQEIDLRIGASFTRLITMNLRSKFDDLPASVISYGPCQFPTLGFIVERWNQVELFVPENFWTINLTIEKVVDGVTQSIDFLWDRHRLFHRRAVIAILELCLVSPTAVITHVKGTITTKSRPLPLSTVEMIKRASTLLRISSHRCMQVAEILYQRGFLSYPRTETDQFTHTMDLRTLVDMHRGHSEWGAYASRLIDQGEFQWPRAGSHNDEAHPPIHPVKVMRKDEGSDSEDWGLYALCTRHFLAACGKDAIGFLTSIKVDVNGEGFHTSGLIVRERNWLDVYPYETWTGREVPNFLVNERLEPKTLNMTESQTGAPSLLTEAELIGKMDRYGIGTDATLHEHIQTVQHRQYAVKNQSVFVPTKLGVALVTGFKCFADEGLDLSKPDLRSRMESEMGLVAAGRKEKNEFVKQCLGKMKRIFSQDEYI
eukprot:GHVR01120711.1.p1 GENE.GHVR01120711.1~~GHVR01120711.1.p1  ORF type:complete len:540 (-),score=90.66 GHVR01120711.1:42-1661(-)